MEFILLAFEEILADSRAGFPEQEAQMAEIG